MKITIGTFDWDEEDIRYVGNAIRSGYLSVGSEMNYFEEFMSSKHGKSFGRMVNSGQSALEVALEVAKLKLQKPSLRVMLPANTYAATLWAIIRTGCIPVFHDIGEDYNIKFTEKDVELSKYWEIDVILSVDLCGKKANIPQPIMDRFFIIEDACEAVGNESCNYGNIICLSFYVSRIITTGSGGMICHENSEYIDFIESFISHGRKLGGDFINCEDGWEDRFKFDKVGASYRSDNLSAALGLSQSKRIDNIIAKRKMNAGLLINSYYENKMLQDNFTFPSWDYWDECVFQFFPILCKKHIDREKLLQYLYEKEIDSRVLMSLTNQEPVKHMGILSMSYKNSEYVNDNGFIIGCHQNLDKEHMNYIIETLKSFVDTEVTK